MVEAAESGDYMTALRLWRPLAAQGYAYAQYKLGVTYDKGQGVPQDYAKAAECYWLAAEHGNACAQYRLGAMYATAQGVPRVDAEAVKWFRLAAEQDLACAQHNLGYMYATARGVPQANAKAGEWYRAAAEQASSDVVARHTASRFARYKRVADVACGMGGDALALVEDLDGAIGEPRPERLLGERVRHRVIVLVDLDMIIEAGAALFPFGVLIGLGG